MVYQPNPQVVEAELTEGAALLDLDAGIYYKLNQTALVVWRGLAAGLLEEGIVAEMRSKFQVEPEQCRRDIASVLNKFLELGLVHAGDGDD